MQKECKGLRYKYTKTSLKNVISVLVNALESLNRKTDLTLVYANLQIVTKLDQFRRVSRVPLLQAM